MSSPSRKESGSIGRPASGEKPSSSSKPSKKSEKSSRVMQVQKAVKEPTIIPDDYMLEHDVVRQKKKKHDPYAKANIDPFEQMNYIGKPRILDPNDPEYDPRLDPDNPKYCREEDLGLVGPGGMPIPPGGLPPESEVPIKNMVVPHVVVDLL
jgi:hypothetical protein